MRLYFLLLFTFALAEKSIAQPTAQSQIAPKVIPPSPNAAAFSKYGDVPVSFYTGVPNISVPIYDIVSRDIKIPISLSYHASGIKVGEEASRVGLGWVLNAGGLISRNIINRDDLQLLPDAFLSSSAPKIPQGPRNPPASLVQNGAMYNTAVGETGVAIHLDLSNYLMQTGINPFFQPTDFEPDQYSYNFLGYSGKFILNKNKEVIMEKQEKIRITPTVTADGSTWQVTTPDGFIYSFLDSERVLESDYTYQKITAWYLSKIKSPQGDSVIFNYTPPTNDRIIPVGSFYEKKPEITLSCDNFNCQIPPYLRFLSAGKSYSNIALASIEWSNGKIAFNYADDRQDIEGDKRLSSIQLFKKNASQPYLEWAFVQDYFTSAPNFGSPNSFPAPTGLAADRALKRLKFTSLIKRPVPNNSKEQQLYLFSYNEPTFIPAKNSFARDHWGYYNGKNGNTSLLPSYTTTIASPGSVPNLFQSLIGVMGSERNASATDMPMLSLKSITYPTKGSSTFYYSANDYEVQPSNGGTPNDVPETYLLPINLPYDARKKDQEQSLSLDLSDEYVDKNGNSPLVSVKAAFRTNFGQDNSCDKINSINNVYFRLVDSNGLTVINVTPNGCSCTAGSMVFLYSGNIPMKPGKYYWKAQIDANETRITDISGILTYTVDANKRPQADPDADGNLVKYRIGGGLRISKIENFDPESGIKNIKRYDYHYKTDVDTDGVKELHSYGRLMVQPEYSYYDVSWEKFVTSGESIGCKACYSLVRDSGHPQANYYGSPIAYDKVTEYFGDGNENGYTEYEFENVSDQVNKYIYPINPQDNLPIHPPLNNTVKNPGNGNLIKQTSYNASGDKLMMVENKYQAVYRVIEYGMATTEIPGSENFTRGHDDNTLFDTGGGILNFLYPTVNSYFTYLSESTQTTFSGASASAVTTKYFYDNPAHFQLTKTITNKSNLHNTITLTKYPADYSDSEASQAILAMKGDKFMHALPVETTVLDEDPTGTKKIKNREFTVYDNFTAFTFPKEKVALQNSVLASTTSVPPYIPSSSYDPTIYRKIFSLDYNASGNLKKIQKTSDMPTAYLWGYNQTLPIAEIKNGTAEESFFTSFEEEGVAFSDASGNAARTGTHVNATGAFTFPVSYSPAASNTLMSYWYWQNNQWNFSGVVPFQRTISSPAAYLDEVRAFPIGSLMTTYTYLPNWGISSHTDANNQTTYYEYDSFGRLLAILDDKRSVLKTFQYVYKK